MAWGTRSISMRRSRKPHQTFKLTGLLPLAAAPGALAPLVLFVSHISKKSIRGGVEGQRRRAGTTTNRLEKFKMQGDFEEANDSPMSLI